MTTISKWGTAQLIVSKGKSKTDVTNWEKKDFESFRKFHEISRNDFYYHIRPYKKSDLYEDLVAYLMSNINPKVSQLPPCCRFINIDSVIIDRDKETITINWIEKSDNFAKKPCYQFTLTYRATRDRFDYNNFIAKNCCGAVLVLIKISDRKIIGRYNPLDLSNMNNYNNYYFTCYDWSYVKNYPDYPKDSYTQWGTTDDRRNLDNFGSADLVLNGPHGTCSQTYYEKKISDVKDLCH
ncbi:4380_t:CDS:2 [Gigaspora margarita]|uniref:4380_t:CDS:1 n=1 Tax=Gigaspora margarita TaxID=4874 RepID=A0ABN7UQ52_GIGMA|nr:4380_t:CDS:2 [Gigaspora margarita]